ncbi:MAG: hydrogenase maturation protease [Phycisphaerales bacterium]|nr:hydrogenase maturation protease [Phycisphaerales bacterium]
MTAPRDTLVIGYGNPGRGDDGIGPAMIDRLDREAIAGVRTISAFQLQVEHAAELATAARAVFIDASLDGPPCDLRRVEPEPTTSFSTHSVSPGQVLALARDVFGWTGEALVLAVRGEVFDQFLEQLSPAAEAAMEAALRLLVPILRAGRPDADPAEQSPTTGPRRPGSTPCRATSL